MGDSISINATAYKHPLEALDGNPAYYQRFEENEKLSAGSKNFFRAYYATSSTAGTTGYWWLRSVLGSNYSGALNVGLTGGLSDSLTNRSYGGVSPCFSFTRNVGDISASLAAVSEGGSGNATQESLAAS
jgi:hypothetical protein